MNSHYPRARLLSALLTLLATTLAVSGCVASGAKSEHSFQESLHACRMAQPGRINRRMNLPASSPAITRCLERKGWRPDGSKLDIKGSTYDMRIDEGEQIASSLSVPQLLAVVVA